MSRSALHGSPRELGGDERLRPVRDLGRVLLALVVIAVGVLYLMEAAGWIDAGSVINDWWPALLVAVGLVQLAEHSHGRVEPWLWMAAGVVLLLFTTDVAGDDAWSWVWPAALVAGGLLIIGRWARSGAAAADAAGDDTVSALGVLGGQTVASTSQAFRWASLTGVLGGVELDLRQARPAPEGARISATAVMGGVDIVIPHGWRVTVNGTPILGGVEDKTAGEGPVDEGAPSLVVDALAVLGGVSVKHKDER